MSRRFWTLANLLTLSRLPLAGLLWIDPKSPELLLGVMALAGITDVLDGWVARRRGEMEGPGAWLDPVCDKTFLLSVLIALAVAYQAPGWVLVLIAVRDILQLPFYAILFLIPKLRPGKSFDWHAVAVSKATTVMQFVTVCALILGLSGVAWMAGATAVLGLIAFGVYLRRAIRSGSSSGAS